MVQGPLAPITLPTADSDFDYLELLIDGNKELLINGLSPFCGMEGYSSQSVDISAYADGGAHEIEFHSKTFAVNGAVSNFFIDVISLPGNASVCSLDPDAIFNNGFE